MSTVTCADCHDRIAAEKADLSANGWRCPTCSLRRQIEVHQGADEQIGELSLHEMEERARRAMAVAVVAILVALASGVLLATVSIDGEGRSARRQFAGLLAAPITGVVVACYELAAWRRARRAIEVMRRRDELAS